MANICGTAIVNVLKTVHQGRVTAFQTAKIPQHPDKFTAKKLNKCTKFVNIFLKVYFFSAEDPLS